LNSNRSLGELYKLLARDEIAPRRAAVMAYTGSLLLRTLPAIEHEQILEEEHNQHDSPAVIWDLPRPDRSQPYTGVVHPTPAELYPPAPNPPNHGNGAPK
jgi:hypothetical protein